MTRWWRRGDNSVLLKNNMITVVLEDGLIAVNHSMDIEIISVGGIKGVMSYSYWEELINSSPSPAHVPPNFFYVYVLWRAG